MARTWLSISVELLGGAGSDPWPYPGRIFAVGPSHTFMDLATSINDAFARWDRAHLSLYTLADGRIVTDQDTGDEMSSSIGGPLLVPLDIDTAKVSRTLKPGDEFQYTFDLGDEWTHRCVVETTKIDPVEQLGIRPSAPLPYWGWGDIPDQYGRRFSDDDGEGPLPERPRRPHPMLTREWPAKDQLPELDLRAARSAIATKDVPRFLTAVIGRDIDDALQAVAGGIPFALDQSRDQTEMIALSFVNRLTMRGWHGDRELSQEILALLRGETPPGRAREVDLEMLCTVREGDAELTAEGALDLVTGDIHLDVDGDSPIDTEADRWLPIDRIGSREGWNDMAAFTARIREASLREKLQRAIDGSGAFRRFRDVVHEEGLGSSWQVYSADRQLGRAREFLAANGIRAV